MNGFFNINKPFGMSSAKIVYLLKKKFNLKDKIGHMGTLDPNATGVLVIGIGRANRLFNIMQNKRKRYIATFEFGYETETLDLESDVIKARSNNIPTLQEIESNLEKMIGKQEQTAPIFSAKKINGRRAYQIARQGEQAEIKPHMIEIFSFKCLKQESKTAFVFEIECSSGTYIRSIARDFSKILGSVATMTKLERTKCGPFEIKDSKTVEELTESDLIDNDFALNHLKEIVLSEDILTKIRNGIKTEVKSEDGIYKVYSNKTLVGIVKVENEIANIPTWLI